MTAAVETMAYNKVERPWHGQGVPVEADLSPEDMVKVAGIDWEVAKYPIYAKNGKMVKVDDHWAIIRKDTGAVLSVVGNRYKPIQNGDAMDFFTKFVKMGGMSMETMGSLHGGKYIWGLAKIGKGFKIGKSDENEGYLLLAHPHVFGQSLILQTTAVRVVCWNTYSAALASNNGRWSMRHSREFGEVTKAEAETVLGIACEQFTQFGEMAKFLAKKKASDDWVKKYFYDVLQLKPKKKEDAEGSTDQKQITRITDIYQNAPGQSLSRGTWWSAFNAVTYMTDHVIGGDNDLRLSRAWFGDRALMKRQALTKAVQYAEAA